MKRIFLLILMLLITTSATMCVVYAEDLQFTDVHTDAWYYGDVKNAVEMGLINGKSSDTYCPDDNLTYAEAFKLAACMHQLYTQGGITLKNGEENWYSTYFDYCVNNNIISKSYDSEDNATRAGYMEIFAHALPLSALEEINEVSDGAIPDIDMKAEYADEVYLLYRAGILQGSDDKHSCKPDESIKRCEVAAILTRMMDQTKRVKFYLVTDTPKEKVSEITWNYDENSKTLTISGKGDMEDYSANATPWNEYRKLIENLVIENGVTSIGDYAFDYCRYLTEITIPDSVTSIGNYAFYYCDSLTEITIPDSVTSIGDMAFSECSSLTEITIPDSVTNIEASAFSATALEWTWNSVIVDNCLLGVYTYKKPYTVGKDIRLIAAGAMNSCSEINVDEENKYYSSVSGVLFNKDKTVIVAYPGFMNTSSYNIPDSVTSIGDRAFYGRSNLTEITIPDGVTSIGNRAFYGCNFTEIAIPDSVTSIGDKAFYGCSNLTEITIPDSVTSIGDAVFDDCESLTEIKVGENNEYYCDIDGVLFDKSLQTIICYPIGKTDTAYTIPDSVTSIGNGAFFNCFRLTEIIIPDSVTSIGDDAFYRCDSLTEITIPDSVTSIGDGVFSFCTSLTEITIPDGVTSIGDGAFVNCFSLTEIIIPDSVTSIGNQAFDYCRNLTEITIPDSVTSIGDVAFFYCESLTEITIPDSVTSIGDEAFVYCESLTGIKVGENNEYYCDIDGVLFDKSLQTIICYPIGKTDAAYTIPDSVTSIGDRAFDYCDNLTEITIPDSVTSIGDGAFDGCESLTDVYYTGTEKQWNAISVGDYNENLKSATIHFNS